MYFENFKLYNSIGGLIKDYRQWHELSQETLAESIRVSVRELQRWEADQRRILVENLHDLSDVTGIPMQVCVALNADQPIWYSLRERRFAYSAAEIVKFSFDELFSCCEQIDDEIIVKRNRISTNRHISAIVSCHHDIYGTEKSLGKDVIKAAAMICPDLNLIALDSWGHHVGHHVCLPLRMDVYEQLKKQKSIESYLTAQRISDIAALHEGVFFCYSIFAASWNAGNLLLIDTAQFYAKIQQKERYLVVGYEATQVGKKICENLGMKMVFSHTTKDVCTHLEISPKIYEIELDVLVRRFSHFGNSHIQKPNNVRRMRRKYAVEKMADYRALPVDGLLSVDEEIPDDQKGAKTQKYKVKMEACPNPKCDLHGKAGKVNIVSNGTYRTKDGALFQRFLCKECGKSFCSRTGSVFYGFRSPQQKVLMAFRLLAKGMSLRGAAKVLEVMRHTVGHWLKVAAEQSEKIDAMLMKELDVSKEELGTLWSFSKRNSLRQRAMLWKTRNRKTPLGGEGQHPKRCT